MKRIIILLIVSALITCSQSLADKITFDDLYSFPEIGNPQFSPDGKKIAFELSTTYIDSNISENHIWIMNSDGSGVSQVTFGPGDQLDARWSPDGRYIAYSSDKGGTEQIWLYDIETAVAKKITSLTTEAWGPEWSPSSDMIIFGSEVYPGCRTDDCNKAMIRQEESHAHSGILYDYLMYRHYKTWEDGRISQLFVYQLDNDSIYMITDGIHDAPTVLLGGYTDYVFSPESHEVCYVMNTDSVTAISTNNDLFISSLPDGEPVRITKNMGQDHTPRYSPDSKYISYLSQARAGYETDQNELVLHNRKTGEKTNLTLQFDRSVGYYIWGPKSEFIYFAATDRGFRKLYRINIKTEEVEKLLFDAVYGQFDLSPDGKYIVTARTLSNQPDELYLYEIKSKKLKRLTYFTKELTDRLDMRQAEEFWFDGFNGDTVHGFLTLPPDFDSSAKYPLVLMIHGGPQYCWHGEFNYYGWNTQLMAAEGYVIAQIDPHGSVGYGLKFKEYVSGNWGRGDYEDLMLGVDYLIENYDFVDSTRMAAMGRSYGGYMTNWICGHTDRFQCLITVDGVYDQISDYGATEELWFPEWEFKGTPWTNRDEYVRSSPSTYAANFKTPTLVIHGQHDYRVDISQAFQMFTALQRQGVPSQFLYFPDEGHSVIKLENLRYFYQTQIDWLARWLK